MVARTARSVRAHQASGGAGTDPLPLDGADGLARGRKMPWRSCKAIRRLVQLKIAEEAARYAQLLANQRYSSGLVDFRRCWIPSALCCHPKTVWPRHKPRSAPITCACTKRWGGGWQPLNAEGQVIDSASAQP